MAKQPDDPYALLVADVYHVAGEMRRNGERIAATAGQTQARWQLMSVASEGDWTVADAARRLGVSRQGVQRIADELVAESLAFYALNPRHQRSPHLKLTERGQSALATITSAARRANQRMARLLSEEELTKTRAALRRIITALESS
jgi:DNA-binding MarR family transcriptional regulator